MENVENSILRVVELESALADIRIITTTGHCSGNANLTMIKEICDRLTCKQ